MQIITVSGKARHGKDTFAEMLKEEFTADGKRVLIIHYADLLKYLCKQYFGWDGVKDVAGRTLLQFVGTDTIRQKDENYWVDFVAKFIKLFPDQWDYVIIPDTRFKNEIERLGYHGFDFVTTCVRRNNFDNGLTEGQKAHPSECDLDDYYFDIVIPNNGTTSSLRNKARMLVNLLEGEEQLVIEGFYV